jgi:predicted dehydrogenase
MQVFGSRGWVEVGDVEHLTTWQMRVCHVDPAQLTVHHKPQLVPFFEISTERAELEHFAQAAAEGRPLAVAGGDEEHGVAVMEAIMESARAGATVKPGQRATRVPKPASGKTAPRTLRKTVRSGKVKRRTPASGRRSGRR